MAVAELPVLTAADFASDQDVRWCPGCGDYSILAQMRKMLPGLGIPREKIVFISGIGCSSRFPYYMNTYGMHSIHGRAPAVATGLKTVRPDLSVLVITGDGDATSIGGNHYIHAARRNIDLTVLLFNNNIYGMTGGQVSPTTPKGKKASTAPYGSFENTFNISGLAQAAGASFVARSGVYNPVQLENYIVKAIQKKGFSLVEIMSPCPTAYGRRNRAGTPVDMIAWQKENSVPVAKAEQMTPEELDGKLITGILTDIEQPECREEYQKLIDRLAQP